MAQLISEWCPTNARVGQPSPQSSPELFSDDAIMKEVRHLIATNKRHGTNALRTEAYMRLLTFIGDRQGGRDE